MLDHVSNRARKEGVEHRQAYLNAVAKYLKPDGRISFYPAEHFGVFDDRYFVGYQRPYGDSVLLENKD